MINRASVQAWLDTYIRAWRTYDPALIGSLYAEDAIVRFSPFDEPVEGRDAIVEGWLEDKDEPDSWKASYRPIAIDGNTAVVNGRTQYVGDEGEWEYDNIFVLEFNDDGQVVNFCEWYMTPDDEDDDEE